MLVLLEERRKDAMCMVQSSARTHPYKHIHRPHLSLPSSLPSPQSFMHNPPVA